MERTETKFTTIPSLSLFFLSLTLLLFFFSAAGEILLGASLSSSNPNQIWSSPANNFSLRFLQVNSSTSYYTLSIIHGAISIWTAGGDSGASVVGAGASFQLHTSGDLRLISSSGDIIWASNTSNLGVSRATLDDYGNFVLKNGSTRIIWSTFDHPTDTIVCSLNFTPRMILTSGLYSFSFQKSGNLTLRWNNSVVYHTLGVNSSVSANLTNPSLTLIPTGILVLSDPNLPEEVDIAYGDDYGDPSIFRFLRLDKDGNLRIYSSSEGSNSVTANWAAVDDQCMVFGYCGSMGICTYRYSNPICECPSQNYQPIDPSDSQKGCKLKMDLKNCTSNQAILQLDHTRFLYDSSEISNHIYYEGISACKQNCLSGPCLASSSLGDGSGQCCMMYSSDYISGYQSITLPSTSFVKVCAPALPNPPPSSEETRKDDKKLEIRTIALAIAGSLLCFILIQGSLWWWFCRKSPNFGGLSSVQYTLLEHASGAPVQFSYKQLLTATRQFKEKLGEGGFGAVYKGVLANKTLVAVKQLEGIEQGEKQFRMEVGTISSTHHLNLVRLIGFCSEGRHRLLVYEFMKNGSLDRFIFPSVKKPENEQVLTWNQRFNIILGTARGLTYLHEECRDCIVHCDIKPENILLDDNYNAKVSDFGLAKLVNQRGQRYLTLASSVRGTRGYLAPEWLADLPISSKFDVYSFGMEVMEIVSGRRNFEVSEETKWKKLCNWAYEEFYSGNVRSIVDTRLDEGEVDMGQVHRAIQVSFWCIQKKPCDRPMMGKVVQMLEGIVEMEEPPPPMVAHEANPVACTTSLIAAPTLTAPSSGLDTCSLLSSQTSPDILTLRSLEIN